MRRHRVLTVLLTALCFCVSLTGQAAASDPVEFITPIPNLPGIHDFISAVEIKTVQQFKDIAKKPNGKYVLKANLDFKDESWKPFAFAGNLDGHGYTIRGLLVDDGNVRGLFTVLDKGARVANLTVKGKVVAAGNGGLLAGSIAAGASVENCVVEGTVVGQGTLGQVIGGVTGNNDGSINNCRADVRVEGGSQSGGIAAINKGTITASKVDGSVTSRNGAGGLAGVNEGTITDSQSAAQVSTQGWPAGGLVATNSGTIERSVATGPVSGTGQTGGLVGENSAGTIVASTASGTVVGTSRVGGLVGAVQGGKVSRSSATGIVTGADAVGGLIGEALVHVGLKGGEPVPSIENSFATGTVIGDSVVGGLIGNGQGGTVQHVYAAGQVTGKADGAGLIGSIGDYLTVTSAHWDKDTTGRAIGLGGGLSVPSVTGLSTAQMRDPDEFPGWDFETVWGIDAGKTYPQLGKPGITGVVDAGFTDTKGHWAEADIKQLAKSGVVSGIGGGLFNPDGSVTRAEFAKMIVLGLGLAPQPVPQLAFTDRSAIPSWATGYVATAAAEGLIKGFDDGRFGPTDLITREQMAAIVVRAVKLAPIGSLGAAEAAATSVWAQADVLVALEQGILLWRDGAGRGVPAGMGGVLLPQSFGTRAEAARAIARLQQLRTSP